MSSGLAERWLSLDRHVERFEAAGGPGGPADLGAHLPPADHPGYLDILCELVRVDLELRRDAGDRPELEDYRRRFPDLFADPRRAGEVAFEDYRLRRQAGEPASPEDYRRRLGVDPGGWPRVPEGADPATLAARAYRSSRRGRVLGTDGASAAPGGPGDLFADLHRADPRGADRLAEALCGWPAVGTEFLGFRLESELGRGSFGRVYLARQGELADRPVALKVAPDIGGESRVLAQLRHTNVVPIYSVHRGGTYQAVCMPYLGSTTLADVIAELGRHETLPDSGRGLLGTIEARQARESTVVDEGDPSRKHTITSELNTPSPRADRLGGLGYVDAVLWIAARLAEGLGHAHDRGILHRDLKPANVLFADDGEPMLLDFNLAADTKLSGHPWAAMVGGTLPYMAPEQLAAYRGDPREVGAPADLYALGVILFQLLTGRPPFPPRVGRVDDVLGPMIADRGGRPPSARALNPAVSPAVDAIVARLLEPEPSRRYASAADLREDLQRQLDDLPLRHTREPSSRERARKWARRHPRLASSTSVGVLALLLAAGLASGLWARHRRVARLEAVGLARTVGDDRARVERLLGSRDLPRSRVAEGLALVEGAADRADGIPSSTLPTSTRHDLRRDLGDLLFHGARALIWAAESTGGDRAARRDRASALLDRAGRAYGPGDEPRALWSARADLARLQGRDDAAKAFLNRAAAAPLDTPRAYLLEAGERVARGGFGGALPHLLEATRVDPTDPRAWLLLADGYAGLGRVEEARRGLDTAIALDPVDPWPRLSLGLLELDAGRPREAEADFDRVLALRPGLVDALVNRALARMGRGDDKGAIVDLTAALARPDAPSRAWFIRATARARAGDTEGARLDREEGRRRTPADDLGWVARGLSRLPADPKGALADIEEALKLNPRSYPALQDKAAILSEHLGRTEEAVAALDRAVGLHPDAVPPRAGRGVLLARLGRRSAAIEDARVALKLDAGASTLYQVAGIYALTSRAEPADAREALRLLAAAIGRDPQWLGVVPADPDLAPIRGRPEFRALIRALTAVEASR